MTFVAAAFLLAACSDRYDEGYRLGYAAGRTDMLQVATQCEQRLQDERRRIDSALFDAEPSVATTVCGGAGVNLNGKHIAPGKTGCVRVLSDGTVERY